MTYFEIKKLFYPVKYCAKKYNRIMKLCCVEKMTFVILAVQLAMIDKIRRKLSLHHGHTDAKFKFISKNSICLL